MPTRGLLVSCWPRTYCVACASFRVLISASPVLGLKGKLPQLAHLTVWFQLHFCMLGFRLKSLAPGSERWCHATCFLPWQWWTSLPLRVVVWLKQQLTWHSLSTLMGVRLYCSTQTPQIQKKSRSQLCSFCCPGWALGPLGSCVLGTFSRNSMLRRVCEVMTDI